MPTQSDIARAYNQAWDAAFDKARAAGATNEEAVAAASAAADAAVDALKADA